MIGADFIAEFRRVRDDVEEPYFWSDAEILTYLNSALDEACERALLIEDRTTAAVCEVPLEAGTADYTLSPRVIQVKRVAVEGRALAVSSVEAEDCDDSLWETRTGPAQRYICTGLRSLRIVPTPVAEGVANLTVYRRELAPVSAKTSPEISDLYHLRLMPWVYRCALLKTDSQAYDPVGAAEQEAVFTRAFGERPDANVQRKRRDRRPPIVRSAW